MRDFDVPSRISICSPSSPLPFFFSSAAIVAAPVEQVKKAMSLDMGDFFFFALAGELAVLVALGLVLVVAEELFTVEDGGSAL